MSGSGQFDVAYVARLARLSLTEEEAALFQSQLGDVLRYIDKLKELDISSVTLEENDRAAANVFRLDEPRDCFDQANALGNAPRQANHLFIVPKVIE